MLLAQEGPPVLELRSTAVLGAGTNSNAAPENTGDESQTGSSPAGFKTKSGTRCSAKSHHSGSELVAAASKDFYGNLESVQGPSRRVHSGCILPDSRKRPGGQEHSVSVVVTSTSFKGHRTSVSRSVNTPWT